MGSKPWVGAASIGILIALVLATLPGAVVAEHTGEPIVASEEYDGTCFLDVFGLITAFCGSGEVSFDLDEIGCEGSFCEADGPPRFGIKVNHEEKSPGDDPEDTQDAGPDDDPGFPSARLTVTNSTGDVILDEDFCDRIDNVPLPADAEVITVAVDRSNFETPQPGCTTSDEGHVALSILLP